VRDLLSGPEERRWLLLRSFFSSWRRFLVLFEEYERRVKDFSRRYDTDRAHLRLVPDDLATLIDFKALEDLRDREVSLLREVSHELFRTTDATDRFDHSVSIIYHELSALKEEHYTLREDFVREESIEYDLFYKEVNRYYPKRLRHIRNLYRRADRRLRVLLPAMAEDRVVVRSLHLFGAGLLEGLYPGGLGELHAAMYPLGGALEAYAVAGRSFLQSGFREEARDAFAKGLAAPEPVDEESNGKRARRLRETLRSEVEAHLAGLEAAGAVAGGSSTMAGGSSTMAGGSSTMAGGSSTMAGGAGAV